MFFILELELLRLEKMMQLAPNFAPRGCGLRVYDSKELPPIDLPHDELIRSTMCHVCNPAFRTRMEEYLIERKEQAMNYRGQRHQSLFQSQL